MAKKSTRKKPHSGITWREWLEKWELSELRFSADFLDMRWQPTEADRNAAWDMYVEMLTRITTQKLGFDDGVEKAALDSVYSLFGLTRETIKTHGRESNEFAKISIVVLNQLIRPFTAKWHRLSTSGAFAEDSRRVEFRRELEELQTKLRRYTSMLAHMAGVEDLSGMEEAEQKAWRTLPAPSWAGDLKR